MEEFKDPFKNIEVIWDRSTTLLKVVVIVLIVFSMAALGALSWVQMSIRNRTDDMRKEAAALEDRNQVLEERIDDLNSQQTILDIAKEELGLVSPDTVLIQPEAK